MIEDERRIITYLELSKVSVTENGEKMVHLQSLSDSVICKQLSPVMREHVGDHMFMRESVALRLSKVGKSIEEEVPGSKLLLLYSYRLPDLQAKRHLEMKELILKQEPHLSDEELTVKTNLFIASPDVAGHPCGAAVDVTIQKDGEPIPMGTTFADFTDHEKIRTFSTKISSEELKNRLFLRAKMLEEGFAPFNGEWWHFSYGDRDWACFYKKPFAIYDMVPFEVVKRILNSL